MDEDAYRICYSLSTLEIILFRAETRAVAVSRSTILLPLCYLWPLKFSIYFPRCLVGEQEDTTATISKEDKRSPDDRDTDREICVDKLCINSGCGWLLGWT